MAHASPTLVNARQHWRMLGQHWRLAMLSPMLANLRQCWRCVRHCWRCVRHCWRCVCQCWRIFEGQPQARNYLISFKSNRSHKVKEQNESLEAQVELKGKAKTTAENKSAMLIKGLSQKEARMESIKEELRSNQARAEVLKAERENLLHEIQSLKETNFIREERDTMFATTGEGSAITGKPSPLLAMEMEKWTISASLASAGEASPPLAKLRLHWQSFASVSETSPVLAKASPVFASLAKLRQC
ncbi:hypothetical protein R1flu_009721 [Riccia fluitans]|uniref:Uncharacterized protein n=1 Tax=Riccia fluitans TaxID=41844 RepID=A0ABD1Z2Y5_9MARC